MIGGQGLGEAFAQRDADHNDRVQHIATAPGARTGLFVREWEKLFVAVPHRAEQRAEVLLYDVK